MADREKLIEVLGEFLLWPSKMKNVWMPQGIEKLADHILAADVVKRERGEWVRREIQIAPFGVTQVLVCTHCGYDHEFDEWFDFCPNCGSDMRGETDG